MPGARQEGSDGNGVRIAKGAGDGQMKQLTIKKALTVGTARAFVKSFTE
jgi:hypothetical protein